MGFLLDTPIVWDLIRHPRGKIFDGIKRVGEAEICTSIVVAAELRFGAARKNSPRLMTQLETILGAIEVLALEAPVYATYRAIRNRLEQAGQPIGANDLLIAAHALTLGHTVVTDNERAFSKVGELRVQNCSGQLDCMCGMSGGWLRLFAGLHLQRTVGAEHRTDLPPATKSI